MQASESFGANMRDIKESTAIGRHDERRASSAPRSSDGSSPSLESVTRGVVLTFGVFDGVHVAHQIVIRRVVNRARALGTDSVVISFDPHPTLAISGEAPPVLTTANKKMELLKMMGVNRVIVEDFNEQFSRLSPEDFVRDILVSRFHALEIVVGYDCAFGKDRTGDKLLLRELGEKYGFAVDVVEPYRLNGDIVSSTRIRTAISDGDLGLAHKLLGRLYSVSGPVVQGKGIGRKIGHATANLKVQEQALPPPGVYAIKVQMCGQQFDGVLNMGIQPTFGENEFRVEVHLLDFEGTLYGQDMEVLFVGKIRDERTFINLEELADQIRKDESVARKLLNA